MKRVLFGIVSIPVIIIFMMNVRIVSLDKEIPAEEKEGDNLSKISGIVKPQETMDAIFNKHNLNKTELSEIFSSAKKLYNLSKLSVGSIYFFEVDEQDRIRNMQYEINDVSFLKVTRMPEGFSAEKVNTRYTKKIGSLYIHINGSLIHSMPDTHKEYLRLALELSDIFAWDIDFFSDIRNGDSVKIIVEELWASDVFKGYGNILAAQFFNNGIVYNAYGFKHDGRVDYYDSNGKSLRKTLLRSPLKFKYISSHFSKRRFHPILRIYRPHHGVDYAAPTGTPVSAAGDGTVLFAGYKGQNGKIVRIRHRGVFETYYGHLLRIPKRIKRGAKVSQGDIIGYVGSTGLSTGPHLDYRIKLKDKFVNPLTVRLPRGKSISESIKPEFKKVVDYMDTRLVSLKKPVIVSSGKEKIPG